MTSKPLDLNNVQGDILAGLVKKTETYLFFQIGHNTSGFRQQLSKLVPFITSTTDVSQHRDRIAHHKKNTSEEDAPKLLKISAVNISFSHKGLQKIGIQDAIGDKVFEAGMLADAKNLGDKGYTSSDGTFHPHWDPAFKGGNIDGLVIISGDCHATAREELKRIEKLFFVGTKDALIHNVITIVGDVRPGKEKGHEHFGYLDGISQPAVKGVDTRPKPGQETVPQGIILLGRDQDTVTRPSWALDGSFLSFRYLFQLVPEFNTFCKENPVPGLPLEEGSAFTGARMMGRWKSGAPLDLAPLKDNPAIGADPLRNNDFRYGFKGDAQSQDRCPFAAHSRKTNPRNDLEKQENKPTAPNRIIRRGTQFGPELTHEEIREQKTIHGRGLLFAAYSSNIANGFQLIQTKWSNNKDFPPNKTTASGATVTPGLDPIIGQTADGLDRTTLGIHPNSQDSDMALPEWVIPKGGEYFFTPSISALRDTFALGDEEL